MLHRPPGKKQIADFGIGWLPFGHRLQVHAILGQRVRALHQKPSPDPPVIYIAFMGNSVTGGQVGMQDAQVFLAF